MSLTPRQQFKFGFLLRCADEALSDEQTQDRVKTACDFVEKKGIAPIRGAADFGKLMMDTLRSAGWYGLGGSALAGLGTGYGLASLTEKDTDPEEVKKQELIAAYRQQADRVRRNMMARSYRDSGSAPAGPKLFS
jgi:hypothetical protein